MEKDYTREAQMACAAYVKAHSFHGPITSMDSDADFSLRETSDLIRQAMIDKQYRLRQIEAQGGTQQELDQQREDLSLLPDREAERIQSEWAAQAKVQAEKYVAARNRHSQPRSTQGVDPDLFRSTLSWIEKQRGRNWWPKKSK